MVAVGTCTIQATRAGNGVSTMAAPVSQSFTVTAALVATNPIIGSGPARSPLPIQVALQVVTFSPIPAQKAGTSTALTASASSGAPVSYASTSTSTCSVMGNTARLIAAGTCTIVASAEQTDEYDAAMATLSFAVDP
jgi:hypothetical protein